MLLYPDSYRQVDDASRMASRSMAQDVPAAHPTEGDQASLIPALNDVIAPLVEAPFARDQWSQRYLHSLEPVRDERLIQSVFRQSSSDIVSRTETFHFQNPGYDPIQFHATLAAVTGQPQRLALIVQILDAGRRLIGFWRKTYWRTPNQELECHFDMIKTRLDCRALRGISKAIKPYFDQLHQALGVAREFVEADWIGRLVWADYYDIDETHFYIENGKRLSTIEVMRRNFARFLKWRGLSLTELVVGTPTGNVPLGHLDQLTSPGDFARIAHRRGDHVDVEVLLDDPPRRVETQSLPVGKAFVLGDFTDVSANVAELIDGYYGEHLCDRVMPYWFGVRHATQSAPVQPKPDRAHRFERHEIAIVGAGLAGLTAAARLKAAGFQPVVYEANPSRIGGRLHSMALRRHAGQIFLGEEPLAFEKSPPTKAVDQTLGMIEAGGEFIGRHHTALQTLAQELGLGLIQVEPNLYQPYLLVSPEPGAALTLNAFATQHQAAIDRIRSVWHEWRRDALSPQLEALPLEQFLDRVQAPRSFRNVICGAVRAQFGAEMSQVSLIDWFDMHPFDDEGNLSLFASDEFCYRIKGGLQQVPQALARKLSQPVRMGHSLTALRSADGKQYVLDFQDFSGKGLRVFADFVVLTIPVNPLKRNIGFDLPVETSQAVRQVSDLPMGDNAKIIAFFNQPFWRLHVPDACFYLSAPGFTLWEPAMETAEAELYPLVVYRGGEAARASEPDVVMAQVLTHLEHVFPAIRQAYITAVQATHWPSCPMTQGSYAGIGELGWSTGQFPGSHLQLAGEALSGQCRGFAEGAVETGLATAGRLIQLARPSIQP